MSISIPSFMLYSFSFILLYIVAWILDLSSLVYLFYKEIFETAPAPVAAAGSTSPRAPS